MKALRICKVGSEIISNDVLDTPLFACSNVACYLYIDTPWPSSLIFH
jgi:hypothetical protein